MINRKHLKEIGCKEENWPETGYTNYKTDEECLKDKRLKKCLKYENKTGVNPIDTWNLDRVALMWLYERLIEFKEHVTGFINLTYHKFKFEGKEYTQLELIDMMIELGEYLIAEPEHLSKNSKAYKKVTSNPHYLKYNELKEAPDTYSEHYEREISGDLQAEEYNFDCNQKFWNIWAVVWPAMWW